VNPAGIASVAHVFVTALPDVLTIDGSDGHHLARVMRVRIGETVTAADDAGQWRGYEVTAHNGGTLTCVATTPVQTVASKSPRLAVAFALTKGAKPETTIAHLTELGVDRIIPVQMAHSVVRWDDAKARSHHERFVHVAREAAMQSRRTQLPAVEPVQAFATLLAHPAIVIGDASTTPIPELVPVLADPPGGEWCVVVGPEGGFSPDERAELANASPYPPMAIGSHVLRAETAALAMAAVLATLR